MSMLQTLARSVAKHACGGSLAMAALPALSALTLAAAPAPNAQRSGVVKLLCPVIKKSKQSADLQEALASISTGGSPDAVVAEGKPALHLAAMEQNHLAVCWLIAKGANPQATDGEGKLFYEHLHSQGMRDVVKSLCEQRERFSKQPSREWEPIIDSMNDEKKQAMSIPSRFIPYMLAFGVSGGLDVNMKTAKGAKWPVRKDIFTTFTRLLLALGWQAESPTPAQQLLCAVLSNDVKAVKKLLKEHAELLPAEGYDLLARAQSGTMIKALLAAGADIKAQPAESRFENPMTLDAINLGASKSVVAALLKAGAGLPAEKAGGNTILHMLSEVSDFGFDELVEVFVKAGADVNAKNAQGNTPLHLAYAAANRPMVEALLAAGAQEEAQPQKNSPPKK